MLINKYLIALLETVELASRYIVDLRESASLGSAPPLCVCVCLCARMCMYMCVRVVVNVLTCDQLLSLLEHEAHAHAQSSANQIASFKPGKHPLMHLCLSHIHAPSHLSIRPSVCRLLLVP